MVRGEGEDAFRRLVNALSGKDDVAADPLSLISQGGCLRAQPPRRTAGPGAPETAHP